MTSYSLRRNRRTVIALRDKSILPRLNWGNGFIDVRSVAEGHRRTKTQSSWAGSIACTGFVQVRADKTAIGADSGVCKVRNSLHNLSRLSGLDDIGGTQNPPWATTCGSSPALGTNNQKRSSVALAHNSYAAHYLTATAMNNSVSRVHRRTEKVMILLGRTPADTLLPTFHVGNTGSNPSGTPTKSNIVVD
jgi:hypothetical protein